MILGFKPQFVDKILNGTKIHSIRVDQHHRWRIGRQIHLATGVRTKNYKQFSDKLCTGTQKIVITFYRCNENDVVVIDGKKLTKNEKGWLAFSDGFVDYLEFRTWFLNQSKQDDFVGRIIHWTGKRY